MEKIKNYFLYFTIFSTGAVILVIEILGTRILTPFYGSTIFVWSSLISITLGFLALGYWLGGKFADKKPRIDLLYWIIFLSGIAILTIPQIDRFVLTSVEPLGLRLGPLVSAFLLFSIPLLLLGTISPFAVRIRAKVLDEMGVTAGNLYAVSTFGSLAGGLLAGFYLVPNFSVFFNVIFLSLILFLLFFVWQLLKILR